MSQKGNLITVHNVRNFAYRTETDFTPAYYTKTYDLRDLDGVDLCAIVCESEFLVITVDKRKPVSEGSICTCFFSLTDRREPREVLQASASGRFDS